MKSKKGMFLTVFMVDLYNKTVQNHHKNYLPKGVRAIYPKSVGMEKV